MRQVLWLIGAASLIWLTSCKSAYEKQGDDHLREGRYIKALQRYTYVTAKGSGSEDFNRNLTLAYIGALGESAAQGQDPEKLDFYRKKIGELLDTVKKDRAAVAEQYAKVVGKVVPELLAGGSFQSEEIAFRFINDVGELGITGAGLQTLQSIKEEYINKALAEAQAHYEASVNDKDPNEGILADYTLNKLMLFIDEPTPEVKTLWSKIKENNLSTYLMYDLEGLVPNLVPSINKYGVLLGIVKYARGAGATTIQVQAYNGSTVPVLFSGKNFILVDEEGNEYTPSRTRGRFSSSKKLEPGQESEVGELTFNVGKDVPLDYLHFKGEAGESKKFLP